MSAHAYRTTRKPGRSEATRERIKGAVRELLAEGTFHTCTVEHVADRAGISRATLYQHFRSRLELVDAICDSFAVNPALLTLRSSVELEDPDAALAETISNRWASGFPRTACSASCTAPPRSTPRRAISSSASAPTAAARWSASSAISAGPAGCAP